MQPKNSVATTQGWTDIDTGELLVAQRGLPDAFKWTKRENTLDELRALAEKPAKRGRGRPKKVRND